MLRRRPLMRTMATTAVIAGTATAVSGRVARRQQGKADQAAEAQAYEQEQAAAAAPPPPPAPVYAAPAPADAPPDTASQLQSLADLHAQGILTDEEFAASKAKVLGI